MDNKVLLSIAFLFVMFKFVDNNAMLSTNLSVALLLLLGYLQSCPSALLHIYSLYVILAVTNKRKGEQKWLA